MQTSSIDRRRHTARGFTLIEVVVALVIGTLLLGLGVPAMWRLYEGSQYRESLREAYVAANTARYKAVTSGVAHDVVFRLEPPGYVVGESRSRWGDSPFAEFAGPVEVSAVVAREVTADRRYPAIRFYADGSSSGGTVTLRRSGDPEREGVRLAVNWLDGRVSRDAP